MAVQRFENLIAWQRSQDLAVAIYYAFKNLRDFGFKDQICRAAVSISSNIAEGFDRSSNADFARFLYISISSCSEVRSMIYLAEKLEYLTTQQVQNLLPQTEEISKILRGLIKSVK